VTWEVFAGVALVALVLHYASASIRDQLGDRAGVPVFFGWCVLLIVAVALLVLSANSARASCPRSTKETI
jgi:uncharacterized membrane protein YecN with MAPEG domain